MVLRLCSADTLWSSWMHTRYMERDEYYRSCVNPMYSGTWKWIGSSREKVMQCLTPVSIANVHRTDPWTWRLTTTGIFDIQVSMGKGQK